MAAKKNKRGAVATGLDILRAEGFRRLRGARVGLLAHAASVDGTITHILDLMLEARVKLVRLFGPEHGLHAAAQDMAGVRSSKDKRTGLRVVSLYGATYESLRPAPRELSDIDVMVIDLQDVGSRYYTFAYTAAFTMHACARAGVKVILLDRPNPIGGVLVEGNTVLVPELQSFVGEYPIAVRHGLTMGELMVLFNGPLLPAGEERAKLEVVWMDGWRRSMDFHATGLPWVLPSPNMPTQDTALVYPGGCLFEGTNLNEGRGTTRPFELVGAPFLDPYKLANALTDEEIPGVRFRPVVYQPTFHKWAGQPCGGVQIHVTDPEVFPSLRTGLAVVKHARAQGGKRFEWRKQVYEFVKDRLAIDLLLGRHELRPLLEKKAPLDRLERTWTEDHRRFLEVRRSVLHYR
ncbi:MAG: DUF1343 domain-containing protein [Myxococcota bacterium]